MDRLLKNEEEEKARREEEEKKKKEEEERKKKEEEEKARKEEEERKKKEEEERLKSEKPSSPIPDESGVKEVPELDEYGRMLPHAVSQETSVTVVTTYQDDNQQFKAKVLSLDGLLEYTKEDTKEKIFEVSLLAEVFRDMLLSRFGRTIYMALNDAVEKEKAMELLAKCDEEKQKEEVKKKEEERWEEEEKREEEKKKEEEKGEEEKKEGEKKEEEEKKEEVKEEKKEEDEKEKETLEEGQIPPSQLKQEKPAKKTPVHVNVNRELFVACRYFDAKKKNYLTQDELLNVLLNAQMVRCKTEGDKMLERVMDGRKFYYGKLYRPE